MVSFLEKITGFHESELASFFDSNPNARTEFHRIANNQNRKNAVVFIWFLIFTQFIVGIVRIISGWGGVPYYNLALIGLGVLLLFLFRYRSFRQNVTQISLILFTVWAITFPFFIIRLGGYEAPTYPVYIVIAVYILAFFNYTFRQYLYLYVIIFFSNACIYFLETDVETDSYIYRQSVMLFLYMVALSGAYIHVHLRKKSFQAQFELSQRKSELEKAYKQLEEKELQLVQKEKLASLGTMTAGIAHEINNPLTFIDGNLQSLAEYINDLKALVSVWDKDFDTIDQQKQYVNSIKERIDYQFLINDLDKLLASCNNGSKRIVDIVNKLKNFSNLDSAEFKTVNLCDSLETMIYLVKSQYTDVEFNYSKKCDRTESAELACNPGLLNQAIMAIIENGIDAARLNKSEIPKIIVSLFANPEEINISITDNGLGISKEVQERMFDPFFTTKDVGKGSGLGLSVAFGIIKQINSDLEFKTALGKGTQFVIKIRK